MAENVWHIGHAARRKDRSPALLVIRLQIGRLYSNLVFVTWPWGGQRACLAVACELRASRIQAKGHMPLHQPYGPYPRARPKPGCCRFIAAMAHPQGKIIAMHAR